MHDEAGFLSAIRNVPSDDVARLVFADWLDEQDDPACKTKAAFIRLELRVNREPEHHANRIRWLKQLRELAAEIECSWLALVSQPKIQHCWRSAAEDCPKRWDRLTPTDDVKTRLCNSCGKKVRYCDTLEEANTYFLNTGGIALSRALGLPAIHMRPPRPPRPRFLARPRPGSILPHRLRPATGPKPAPPPALPQLAPKVQSAPQAANTEYENGEACPNVRRSKSQRRQKGRRHNRNLQRESWEDAE